jgi:hypothetical protein
VTFYSAPARTQTTEKTRTYIRKLTLTNTGADDGTVSIYLVPVDGAPIAGNQLVKDLPVPAGKTVVVKEAEGHILEPGGTIQALKTAAEPPVRAITIMASGVEFK